MSEGTNSTTQGNNVRLDNSELARTSFWISQVFMIIATVAGVYLAGKEGLNQAITFDNLSNMQSNYYLRHSLHDEVSENVATLLDYVKTTRENRPPDLKRVHPQLADFVWDAMKYSPTTLETPSELLSPVRQFYLKVDSLLARLEARHILRSKGLDELEALCLQMQNELLPKLQTNYQGLATELKRSNIDV